MSKKFKINPSIYCCNLLEIKKTIINLIKLDINQIHFDVMDSSFVNNFGLSSKLLIDIKKEFPNLIIDLHYMGYDLINKIHLFKQANYISFHINSCKNEKEIKLIINGIKKQNLKVGLVVDIENKLESIENLFNDIDLITFMSIKPGFTGQKFDDLVWQKLKLIKKYKKCYPNLIFQIDGGVRWNNIKKLISLGIDWIVVGSIFFNESKFEQFFDKLNGK